MISAATTVRDGLISVDPDRILPSVSPSMVSADRRRARSRPVTPGNAVGSQLQTKVREPEITLTAPLQFARHARVKFL